MFLLNDISISDSFDDAYIFKSRLDVVMKIRSILREHGHDVFCKSELMSMNLVNNVNLFRFANDHLSRDQRLVLVSWLAEKGPFWSENRLHTEDDYYSINDDRDIVTDSSVAEAAARYRQGISSVLLSFLCDEWNIEQVDVKFHSDTDEITTSIINYLSEERISSDLPSFEKPIKSWADLEEYCRNKYKNLFFLENSFSSVYKQPYANTVANMTLELLEKLSLMKTCFNEDGSRNALGNELYQNHFTGDKAWFTDSSDKEKKDFKDELTFKGLDGEDLFCPWHGKIKTPQFRIHFSWPIASDRDIYVAYIGPKITKV